MKGRVEKMKRILFGLGFFLFLYGPISSSEAVVDRVVAVVNQEIITLSEVEKLTGPLQQEIQTEDRWEKRERVREVCQKVLEKMIEEKLIDQEVKKAGVKVPSKDVEGALEEIKQRNSATQEDLEKALTKDGVTLEAFKKDIEKKLLRMKLINWAIKTESKVEEKELRDFYQKNIDRYRRNESYRPGHILFIVPKGATPEEIREIRRQCQKVLEKIKWLFSIPRMPRRRIEASWVILRRESSSPPLRRRRSVFGSERSAGSFEQNTVSILLNSSTEREGTLLRLRRSRRRSSRTILKGRKRMPSSNF
jgi:hypothetical protein